MFEKDITQPKGKSTVVWALPKAQRQGTTDAVEVWTAGLNTSTLARVTVPVNCDTSTAINTTGASPLPTQTGDAPAPPAALASTGVRLIPGLTLLGFGVIVLGGFMVALRRVGKHS